jgi:hydroxymethylglutaryl-CoA reductase
MNKKSSAKTKKYSLGDMDDMTPQERLKAVAKAAGLTKKDAEVLAAANALSLDAADRMIDNVIGTYSVPLAVAPGFVINGKEYIVPMACEEPYVVKCTEKAARLVAQNGGFSATNTGSVMISQIQLTGITDPLAACFKVHEHRNEIIARANEVDPILVSVGGGTREVEAKTLSTEAGPMVVVQLLVDTRDAMGANAVNTIAEKVAPLLESITGGKAYLRILSNLAVHRLVRVRAHISKESLGGAAVVTGILTAHAFAAADPYRAATSNKGVMNGASPVACATGNDMRALEAGAHAYASRSGKYGPITAWERDAAGDLSGTIEMPMAVGTVGGTTKTHPLAQIALRMMRIESAAELGQVIAAAGLAANLWTLRALATGGLQAEFVPAINRQS